MHRVVVSAVAVTLACTLAACSSSGTTPADSGDASADRAATTDAEPVPAADDAPTSTTTAPFTTARATTPPTTSGAVLAGDSTTVPPTSTTTTVPPTTSTTTTAPPTTTTLPPGTPASGPLDLDAEAVLLGTSLEGRPIVAERLGTIGGRRVLVIGVIHGNEDAGVQIVDELRARADSGSIPRGIELWLVESMNPDGQAVQDRHNANQVDLNRNFPLRWGPIGVPGDGQYAGTGPASEPETQAVVAFIGQLRPDIAMWYHQDANLIIPSSGRDGRIRARYAELTGLPIADCCDGGVYTGIAATWARDELSDQGSVAFIVELPGGELTPDQVASHSNAVVKISLEG